MIKRAINIFTATTLLIAPFFALLISTEKAFATPAFTNYQIPTANSLSRLLTKGPDGAVWFAEYQTNKIGRIDASGNITEYAVSGSNPEPYSITSGPDGALWFTLSNANEVGRITTSGSVTFYSLPTGYSANGITTGGDGALWMSGTLNANATILRLTTSGNTTSYPIAANYTPYNITSGTDGNLWFVISNPQANIGLIGKMTTSGVLTAYTIPNTPGLIPEPGYITSGPDNAMWFTVSNSNQVDRMTTTGAVTSYSVPGANPSPTDIISGPDGALWFTEGLTSNVDQITTGGVITQYSNPSLIDPVGIAAGGDNGIWVAFPSSQDNSISRLYPIIPPSAPGGLSVSTPTQNPQLTWQTVVGADSYNIYRNGTSIASSMNTSYLDNTAPEGTNNYYVTAVNSSGESAPSNNVNVLVDRTPPEISYTLSPNPNSNGWNNSNVTVSFSCADSLSGIASCSSPTVISTEGANQQVTGTAVDNAGNISNATATVNLDKTAPTVTSPSMSSTLIIGSSNVTISASASDNLSGVKGGEYYIDTDPGQGRGTAMTYSGSSISTTSTISGLSPGQHTIYIRSEDKAGNWSVTAQVQFTYV